MSYSQFNPKSFGRLRQQIDFGYLWAPKGTPEPKHVLPSWFLSSPKATLSGLLLTRNPGLQFIFLGIWILTTWAELSRAGTSVYLLVRNILVATKGSVQTHDSNENSSRDEPGFTIERLPPLSPEDRVMLNEGGGRAGWRGGGGRGQQGFHQGGPGVSWRNDKWEKHQNKPPGNLCIFRPLGTDVILNLPRRSECSRKKVVSRWLQYVRSTMVGAIPCKTSALFVLLTFPQPVTIAAFPS